ncbi:MAG: 3'(2'),5'-bisphosphate nucleotidase [Myxococcales bacterium]|nr:3'(2'),5'-bisphosphate nucleotidase [Myxococcales bacterium]MCB9714157.1 3'(2'),5'-bisphosphate nucleotidase [Myxococcales bacterium]
MGETSYERELQAATAAVVEAAAICRSIQGAIGPDVLEKRDRSPVTVADYCSQVLVCRALARTMPHDPIVAEEDATDLRRPEHASVLQRMLSELAGAGLSGEAEVLELVGRGNAEATPSRMWTLDPIDGTKGFLRGEQYAIALGLIVDGQVVVGALACPNLALGDELGSVLTAVRGQGAFMAALARPGERRPIRVSDRSDPSQARTCESVESGHSAHDVSAEVVRRLGIAVDPVRLDSQAKYAVVARGDAEAYLRLPTRKDYEEKIWDHAAGCLVVEEAGGRVTDVQGRPLDFSRGRTLAGNRGVVASNAAVHDRFLQVLAELDVR